MQGLTGNCPAKCGQLPYRMVSPLRRRFVGVGHEKILKPCETTVLDTAKVMFQQDFKAIMFPVLRSTSGYPCHPQCDLTRPTSTKQPPPLTTSLSGSSSNFSLMNLKFFAWTMAAKHPPDFQKVGKIFNPWSPMVIYSLVICYSLLLNMAQSK